MADMAEIAPMLAHFGYDPEGNPPNYGEGVIACSFSCVHFQASLISLLWTTPMI